MNSSKVQFKDREEKIEKDFSRLLDRYNRSKQVIDQLYQSNQKPERADTTFKSETQKIPTREKDTISKDKYTKVRQLNKELKLTLKEYIDRAKELEATIQNKDDIIFKIEKEVRENQDNLYKNLQEQKEIAFREEQNQRIQEELKNQVQLLKQKILKKKNKIQLIKESQKHVEKHKFEDQSYGFKSELERVQKLCEDFSIEIKDQEKKNLILKEENDILKQALSQRDEQCRYLELHQQDDKQQISAQIIKIQELSEDKKISQLQFDNLNKKVHELEELLKSSDSRLQLIQNKFDQEKHLLQNDFEKQQQQKRDKNKQLKQQIGGLEQKIANHSKEELNMSKYAQDLKTESFKIQSQLDEQRQKTDQALKEASIAYQQLKGAQDEIYKSQQIVKQLEDQIQQYDVQYHIDQKDKQKFQTQIDFFNDEISRLQHLLYESDREIQYMRQQQEEEIQHIEKKVDSLVLELQVQKEETLDGKAKLNDVKKQLIQQEEQATSFKGKYLKQKQTNKNLEQDIKYVILKQINIA
ncbi:hypothetical protein pb186bvf_004595 [Paramecium bursaria]